MPCRGWRDDRGSHHLIQNGAELVTKPEHIMEAYGIIQEDIREKMIWIVRSHLKKHWF
jgi:predicted Rossmann fold nucleotide-binding protein DprA/Smf involved in DNA uptake